jgi:hypothetical protein
VSSRNSARRGRSRKRRPRSSGTAPSAPRAALTADAPKAKARQAAEVRGEDERPRAPWHPWPLSELLILVGIIATVIAWLRGVEDNAALLGAGIGAVAIGTIEVSLREHLSGFRSHTLMLAVVPAVVAHSLVLVLVLAVNGSA